MTVESTVPADQAADLVRLLYRAFLGRDPSGEEVDAHAARLREDAIAAVMIIAHSTEASAFRAVTDDMSRRALPEGMLPITRSDLAEVVIGMLATARQSTPSAYEVTLRVDDFAAGTTLANVLDDLFQAPPPPRAAEDDGSIDRTTQIMYRLALGRAPGPGDLATWRGAVAAGGRLSDIVFGIGESPEAQQLRGGLDIVPGAKVQLAFEIILGRGASAAEVDHYRTMIEGHALDVAPMIGQLFAGEATRRLHAATPGNDPRQAYLFGSRGMVNIAEWQFGTPPSPTSRQHRVLDPASIVRLRPHADLTDATDAESDVPVVSIVTSLYRGGAFIRSFLENITSQTIFRTHCELIIVDAASPDGEQATIEEFCRDFPNIVYRRAATRIGIYEAWNIGIGLARGRYITNANLDDIRRVDSLEIQAALLDTLDFVDVTYQDVLYTFSPRLPFDEIERHGLHTDLPIVSQYNLMEFNSPHNAPMWRAALHREIGTFDQTLQSAADFQFWLRCRAAGKTFYKSNEAHAAYYVNPEGISTRPDTRGAAESNAISHKMYRNIVSPLLVIPHAAFLARIDEIERAPQREGRRYDIVQSALIALGARRAAIAA